MNERIEADIKAAMLARDTLKVNVLKSLKNSLQNEAIAKRRDLTEDEILAVLKREAKQRDEAAELYRKGNSTDRADQETAERAIINDYLPAQLDETAIKALVEVAVAKVGKNPANTGQIIGMVMAEAKGQADGQTVAAMVKEHLS